MADRGVKLFLSCVSGEFGVYRDALRHALTRPNVEVKIQEDFKALGGDTLRMLEDYIAQCEAVVHFVGEMAGSTPVATNVDDLLKRRTDLPVRLAEKGMGREALASLTYTQWEAWLAIYFDKKLLIVRAGGGRWARPVFCAERNFARVAGRALEAFESDQSLSRSAIHERRQPCRANRDLSRHRRAGEGGGPADSPAAQPAVRLARVAVHGPRRGRSTSCARRSPPARGRRSSAGRCMGSAGSARRGSPSNMRCAHEADYSALLFVRADDPATLDANLAALAGVSVLDLAEKEAREDAVKIEAALRWLEAHPTWLMILDNVDDEKAVAAVDKLMARLKSGHVIVTARAATFPASLRKLELDVLDEDAATEFLLERTRDDRARADDDADEARAIARELDGLALGLEHAGAYIATLRIGFAGYLKRWRESRQKVLDWFGPALTSYDKSPRDDLGDLGRSPLSRKPPPARPPRDAGAGPDSQFAPRRRRPRRGGGL